MYDEVRTELESLIVRSDLPAQAATIGRAFDLLGQDALAVPAEGDHRHSSTLNEDGTPFQWALLLRDGEQTPLQFLSEVGCPGLSNRERRVVTEKAIASLGSLFGCERELEDCRELLETLAPRNNPELAADHGGTFWVGASWHPRKTPRLLIYINSAWGSVPASWCRLDAFAAYLGAGDPWSQYKKLLQEDLRPLGVCLNLRAGQPPAGRIYVRGYGKPLQQYAHLAASAVDESFAQLLHESARTLLAEHYAYPTRSVVCSYGLKADWEPDFKVEFCGHCLFSSDSEAVSRCLEWLQSAHAPYDDYVAMLRVLAQGGAPRSGGCLHSFVGVGFSARQPYSTLYLNPGAARVEAA